MAAYGIIGFGAYVPRKRMSRAAIFDAVGWAQGSLKSLAKGGRAFAEWDEDAITMGLEAARDALRGRAAGPAALCFASTTAPFLDRQNAGVIRAALDLPTQTHCFDFAGSQRAGLSAVIASSGDKNRDILVVAAEKRPVKSASALEMQAGDAGAAILLGRGAPIAEVIAAGSVSADLVDHYRTASSHTDYTLEERWFRDEGLSSFAALCAKPMLAEAAMSPEAIDHIVAPTINPALAKVVAEAVGARTEAIVDPLFQNCGHSGAAHPLLMLCAVLEKAEPGETILVTAFGQGCDAVLLRITAAIADARRESLSRQLAEGVEETNYARFLAAGDRIDIDWGIRAERDNRTAQTVAFNKSRDIYGFVGGFCAACDTPQFPKSRRCVNPDCGALDKQEDYRFADRIGRIKSFTEDWMAFTRSPPLVYGNISFEGGGNAFMEMCDFAPGDATIGAEVEMRFRIKDIDTLRGYHRYFWKAAPASGGRNG